MLEWPLSQLQSGIELFALAAICFFRARSAKVKFIDWAHCRHSLSVRPEKGKGAALSFRYS